MKRHSAKTESARVMSAPGIVAESRQQQGYDQSGFTILETTIALLLMLIVALGSASLFSFSIYNNSGGSDRAVSLALAQQTLETLRSVTFTTAATDARLNGGTLVQNGVLRDGRSFQVTTIIDDNPATAAVDVAPNNTLKSITIIVESQSIGRGWAAGAGGRVTLITQRTRTE